jgi:DNA repair protein RadC
MDTPLFLNQKVSEVELNYKNKVKPSERIKISGSKDAYEVLRQLWSDKIEYVEEFYVLFLNRANQVLAITKVSEGGTCGCLVDPKRVFQTALKVNSQSLILSHNHPSGNTRPSEADIQLTRKLKEGGLMLDIAVLDHLILTSEGYLSFADEGLL